MAVHLRQKELKNGLMSLYLDYYPPIRKNDGKLTRREFLNRTILYKLLNFLNSLRPNKPHTLKFISIFLTSNLKFNTLQNSSNPGIRKRTSTITFFK